MEVVAIYLRGRLEAHNHPRGYCRPHNKSYGDAARNKPNAENRASRRTLSSVPERRTLLSTYNLLTGSLQVDLEITAVEVLSLLLATAVVPQGIAVR